MRFLYGGRAFAYLTQRLVWQLQKQRRNEIRRRHAETWRIVRQQAAKSRLEHQQNVNNSLTTPRRNSTDHDS